MTAKHNIKNQDPLNRGPDLVPQAAHPEVSPGDRRNLRGRVLTFIGHVPYSRHRARHSQLIVSSEQLCERNIIIHSSQERKRLSYLHAHTQVECLCPKREGEERPGATAPVLVELETFGLLSLGSVHKAEVSKWLDSYRCEPQWRQ